MSLYPSYVLDDQGNWWKDPTIEGDGWFICFDEDDGVEMVLAFVQGDKRGAVIRRAAETCKDCGIPATPMPNQYPTCSKRHVDGKFKDAWSVELRLDGPVPVNLMPAGKKPVQNKTRRFGGTYFGCIPEKYIP